MIRRFLKQHFENNLRVEVRFICRYKLRERVCMCLCGVYICQLGGHSHPKCRRLGCLTFRFISFYLKFFIFYRYVVIFIVLKILCHIDKYKHKCKKSIYSLDLY